VVVLSYFLYRFFEKPMTNLRDKKIFNWWELRFIRPLLRN
jgi:peptidoglycan/LPS O-acetylase OafA/YrhL